MVPKCYRISQGGDNVSNRPSNDEFDTTVEVLSWLKEKVQGGDYDGWGLDPWFITSVKTWIENERDGRYS